MKKILGLIFLIAWVAGEAPRLWWKETVPVRPMDAAAGLIFLAEIIGNKNYKSYKNIGLIIAVLAGSWILGPYAARTLVYGWLIWKGGEIFSRVRKWVAPAMASFLILGLGQYIFLPDTRFLLQYGWDEHYYRLIGTVLDPNYFGVMAGMMGLYAISKEEGRRKKEEGEKIWERKNLWFAGLAFVTLILTFSRASWLAFGLAAGWWGISGVSGKSGRSGRLRKLGILGVLGIFGVMVWWAAPKPGGEGVNLLRTSSIQQRFTNWNEAISVWKQHPWVGVGSREYGVGNAPSSSWLLILEATGILGSVGAMMWVIWVIREIRGDKFWMGMAIMVGVHAIFNNTLFYPPVLGLLALLRIRSLR